MEYRSGLLQHPPFPLIKGGYIVRGGILLDLRHFYSFDYTLHNQPF